ncbi:putative reverse transcriptase [Senna tora]|uniref:Putative reverse transcriptase n=1 Tax=Senna tora TaxID=362788 RepID=A0A834W4C8_9FABA|nr:putative reverse transcriptase [Senna tora]
MFDGSPRKLQDSENENSILTSEERDLLERSNKKVKTGDKEKCSTDLQPCEMFGGVMEIPMVMDLCGDPVIQQISEEVSKESAMVSTPMEESPTKSDRNPNEVVDLDEQNLMGSTEEGAEEPKQNQSVKTKGEEQAQTVRGEVTTHQRFAALASVEDETAGDEGTANAREEVTPMNVDDKLEKPKATNPNPVENKSKGIKVKQKRAEISSSINRKQPYQNQQSTDPPKPTKNHAAKANEHTLVTSSSQGIRNLGSINNSPQKGKEGSSRIPPKPPNEGGKSRLKKPPDHDEILQLMRDNKRLRVGLVDTDICKRCGVGNETSFHALRDCSLVKPLWQKLVTNLAQHDFFSLNLQEWIKFNLENEIGRSNEFSWGSMFGTTCWMVWKQRNEWIFSNKKDEAMSLINRIKINVKDWIKANSLKNGNNRSCINQIISWKPPEEGWIKINTDGAYNPSSNRMACGGVLRNEKGEWIMGFAKPLGSGNALQAELCGMLMGLDIAWKNRMKKIILESDSLEAVELAEDPSDRNHPLQYLIGKIKNYKDRDWQFVLKHTFREANKVADCLAKTTSNRIADMYELDNPPVECIDLLETDAKGFGLRLL